MQHACAYACMTNLFWMIFHHTLSHFSSYVNNIIIAEDFNIDLNSDSSKIFELLIRFITTY